MWTVTNECHAVEQEIERREVIPFGGEREKTADGKQVEDEDHNAAYEDSSTLQWASIAV